MAKSGHSGKNPRRSSCVRASHLSSSIQATSGDRSPPPGSSKPVEESKVFPALLVRFHSPISRFRSEFQFPVSPPVGAITIRFPCLFRSSFMSGLSIAICRNWLRLRLEIEFRLMVRAAMTGKYSHYYLILAFTDDRFW